MNKKIVKDEFGDEIGIVATGDMNGRGFRLSIDVTCNTMSFTKEQALDLIAKLQAAVNNPD
jgi:hypothetical protein